MIDQWKSFSIRRAWIITRREVRDTMRDWRLVLPIAFLTIVFPALMQITANAAQRWAIRWGGEIVGDRLMPFLMMIVGFFPISFSLVIALETFAGEKERHSLEPLLASPLSNAELYWGKTLAAMIPPLCASYLGLTVYLTGLYFVMGWAPTLPLLALVLLLTTTEALVMVSAAVVISSQTTSVRAANILASFVIIPMALLIQGESVLLFWAHYGILWWVIAALVIVNLLLVRMGIHLFDREELLGRDIDQLKIKKAAQTLGRFFLRSPQNALSTEDPGPRFSLRRIYARDIPYILKQNRAPILLVAGALAIALGVGWAYSSRFPLPEGLIQLDVPDNAVQAMPDVAFLPSLDVGSIWWHNVRSLLLGAALGLVSLGTLPLTFLLVPLAIIGFFCGQMPQLDASPWLFMLTFVLPHGIVELPAAIISTGLALRLGATVVSPPSGLTLSEGVLRALADLVKVFGFLVLPLLAVASALEVWLTPWVVTQIW
jgi:uncharacterized membrane protein SpoIIM required for sporulation/ABC-type transport system involved in multi-copper enzyme maturation permease subunit